MLIVTGIGLFGLGVLLFSILTKEGEYLNLPFLIVSTMFMFIGVSMILKPRVSNIETMFGFLVYLGLYIVLFVGSFVVGEKLHSRRKDRNS